MRTRRIAGFLLLLVFCAASARANTDFHIKKMNSAIVAELRQAWQAVERGASNREAAVLIVEEADGSYRAVSVRDEQSYQTIRLEIPPHTVAIFHTHPNHLGGEPSPTDRRNSDLLGIPNFTLTERGVWVYDPRTKRTSRIHYMLAWLNPDNWLTVELPR